MENYFNQISQYILSKKQSDEEVTVTLSGEKTQFVRFNKSKIRQSTDVNQLNLSLAIQKDEKEYSYNFSITGKLTNDQNKVDDIYETCRTRMQGMAKATFFVPFKNNGSSSVSNSGKLKDIAELNNIICRETAHVDLAGILTSGISFRGNINSLGQSHWFESESFCVDYSLYSAKEKAVKGSYGGSAFDLNNFKAILNESIRNLKHMEKDNKVLAPGQYRCYLAPAAVNEILDTFCWGGTSQGALKQGSSPLLPYENEGKRLSPHFTLKEDFSLGLSPQFNGDGEVFTKTLPIFKNGQLENLLVSSRTAKEYGLTSNAASSGESLRSPVIETGDLGRDDILNQLGTGLYISNLHYLNWSDQKQGRITGMTRFACFWVENGEIIAPIKDLRFDDTIYKFWGENLEHITEFAETELNSHTYSERSLGGSQCPGMLVKDFNFTL
ncbi:MAG: TldD/PmbA family protein [Marinicellaceae bacterium]